MSLPQFDMEVMIRNIKRRCAVPTSQLTYTESDFAELCTDELQETVVPLLMSTREEYFVESYDVATPADKRIPFPPNTVASKIRSLVYVQQSSPPVYINLPRLDFDVVAGVGFSNFNTLAGFYIQGNDMVLYPPTSVPVGTMLRMMLYRRTLSLAPPALYGRITSIDTVLNTVVLDFVPTTWVVGTELNSINSISPFDTTNASATIVTVSSPTLELTSIDGMSVGDYISEVGFSAIPQIPVEAQGYLAQVTAAKCLEGLGDQSGMQAAMAKAMELKTNLLIMISQRVDGSVKKVMNPSGGLRLNAGIGRWGRGWSGGGYGGW